MTINKPNLLTVLEPLAAISGRRSTLPVLSSVRLEAVNNLLTIRASDLNQDESATIACDGELPAICVSARILSNLVKCSGDSIEIQEDKQALVFKSIGEARIACVPASEFPPQPTDTFKAVGLNTDDLADGIEAVEWAQSEDPGRYVLNSVHVLTSAKELVCEATSGNKMGYFSRPSICAPSDFMVGRDFTKRFVESLRKPGAVLHIGERYLKITHDSGCYFCKQIEEKYTSAANHLKQPMDELGNLSPEQFLEPLGLCAQISTQDHPWVTAAFGGSGCTISLNGTSSNHYTRTIDGKFAEAPLRLGLKTFTDALRAVKSDTVTAYTIGELKWSPLIIKAGELTVLSSQMRPE